mmetsp:Transcript_7923/g.15488  ORF Transcript_7923/g.15488 Transcript_7923/m.15488 type:complete len:256 (+) Transcript_7923:217-984(+)
MRVRVRSGVRVRVRVRIRSRLRFRRNARIDGFVLLGMMALGIHLDHHFRNLGEVVFDLVLDSLTGLVRRRHAQIFVHHDVQIYEHIVPQPPASHVMHIANNALVSEFLANDVDLVQHVHVRLCVHKVVHCLPPDPHAGLHDHSANKDGPNRIQVRETHRSATNTHQRDDRRERVCSVVPGVGDEDLRARFFADLDRYLIQPLLDSNGRGRAGQSRRHHRYALNGQPLDQWPKMIQTMQSGPHPRQQQHATHAQSS